MPFAKEIVPTSREEMRATASAYFQSLLKRDEGAFRFGHDGPSSVIATAYCVLGLEFCGGLRGLADHDRGAVIRYLKATRDRDGMFREPAGTLPTRADGHHDERYLLEETTAFALQALDALDATPPDPRRWPESWRRRPAAVVEVFNGLRWDDAWRDSNMVMFTLAQLCHDAERHRDPRLLSCVDAALDWLDEHLSPETGLWSGPHAVSPANAMAATFHFSFFYQYRRRPLRYPERIIDSCLGLQREHGLFSGDRVGHTCLDYDAVDLLAKATCASAHREEDVRGALRRARRALFQLRDPDTGAFAHCRERTLPRPGRFLERAPGGYRLRRLLPQPRAALDEPYHTGSSATRVGSAAGNPFSTWFRAIAIELSYLPGPGSGGAPRFRRLPFLGYHDPLAAAATAARGGASGQPAPVRVDGTRGPVVSVIIPARDEESVLPDTLAALRRQSYPNWEALVVDDGSTDRTAALATEWRAADDRVHVLGRSGRGLAAARNVALSRSRGDLVHCMDADDWIEPDFYEHMVAAFEHRGSEPACAVSSVGLVWPTAGIAREDSAPDPNDYALRNIAARNVRQPVCHVFNRSILDRTGAFDVSLDHCHDWDLWLRFARVGVPFLPVRRARAWYRLRPDSLSTRLPAYVRDGSVVARRALASDARLPAGAATLSDDTPVREGIARFWHQNVLRALNRLDEEGAAELFAWARRELAAEFWSEPERVGVRPSFAWAYDSPASGERTYEGWLARGDAYLSALTGHWPELGPTGLRAVAEGIVSGAVDLAYADPPAAGARRAAGTISALTARLGRLDPRVLGLRTLASVPAPRRRGVLRLLAPLRRAQLRLSPRR